MSVKSFIQSQRPLERSVQQPGIVQPDLLQKELLQTELLQPELLHTELLHPDKEGARLSILKKKQHNMKQPRKEAAESLLSHISSKNEGNLRKNQKIMKCQTSSSELTENKENLDIHIANDTDSEQIENRILANQKNKQNKTKIVQISFASNDYQILNSDSEEEENRPNSESSLKVTNCMIPEDYHIPEEPNLEIRNFLPTKLLTRPNPKFHQNGPVGRARLTVRKDYNPKSSIQNSFDTIGKEAFLNIELTNKQISKAKTQDHRGKYNPLAFPDRFIPKFDPTVTGINTKSSFTISSNPFRKIQKHKRENSKFSQMPKKQFVWMGVKDGGLSGSLKQTPRFRNKFSGSVGSDTRGLKRTY